MPRTSRRTVGLPGLRGWLLAGGIGLALAGVVASQVRPSLAHAEAPAPRTSPVAAVAALAPSPVAAPAPATPLPRPVPRPRVRRVAPHISGHIAPPAADLCSGPGWQQRRGQAALATLRDTGQRSGVTVSFLPARSGYLGLTYPAQHHVDVFVRSCTDEPVALLRHVLSHEMGHAYDAAHMTAASRAAYEQLRGIPAGTPWFGCSYCTDFATPAGDFAETYSQWQRGAADSRTRIARIPDAGQLAQIAAAFFGA